jgi:hypothetical protein
MQNSGSASRVLPSLNLCVHSLLQLQSQYDDQHRLKIALAIVSTTIQSKYLPTKTIFINIRGDYVAETRKRNKYDYA